MTQEQIAARIVELGLGHRKPLSKTRCVDTIELASPSYVVGNVYITRRGDVRTGYTLRSSQRVPPQTRRWMIGETT